MTIADAIRKHLDCARVIVTNDGERERIIAHVMIDIDHPRRVDAHHYDMWQSPVTLHAWYEYGYSDDDVYTFHEINPFDPDAPSRFQIVVDIDYDLPDDELDKFMSTFFAPHSESHAY